MAMRNLGRECHVSNAELSPSGFFEPTAAGFVPFEAARGPWGPNMIGGQGLTALAAREVERRCPFDPAGCRLTLDFVAPSSFAVVATRTELVRSSNRVALIHLELRQLDRVVVRGSALFLRPSETDQPDGEAWTPPTDFTPPPTGTTTPAPMLSSAGYPTDWSASFADHRNNARKRLWTSTMVPAVSAEKATPFTRIATLAEATSFVANWDGNSVPFINVDVTHLYRMPASDGLGLESNGQHAADGIAIGSATLHDEFGPLGVSSVTAVANTARRVRF
ncbi:hypothetical protein GPX89_41930 [Nocardia sp. ET3-3]|uniref:Acyl-CoA thioesterase-like N-terminal HotDog domain-containing protein n=1 Tax=Nocardia terrae TaxID=2675851 RepID=A0A7K1VAV2_9NOCA|nr:acyl-CoA thioesterase domain-containing protein [Nocardia terrae]MVU83783.1 hypothetical protein [Nocardia terrae]